MVDAVSWRWQCMYNSMRAMGDLNLRKSAAKSQRNVTEFHVHCVSKNDTDVTHYRFNPRQPISVIFGRDVAERVCYWMVIYYPTSPN